MDPSVLAAAALQARNKIVKNQKEEVITTSDKEGGTRSSFQKAPSKNFSLPKATAAPEKPADWKKPDKKYGGAIPKMTEGPGAADGAVAMRPDLSTIGAAIVQRVQNRKERITSPGYCMKVRDSCPLPCCQYLHDKQEEEQQQKIIIKKVIRRRRPKQKAPEQAASAPGHVPPLVQETPPPLFETPPNQQQQAAKAAAQQEAARRQQQEAEHRRQQELQRQQQAAERQRQEAERRRQEELQRQRQLEEQRRQQAEAERQRQQQAAEAERQRQAAAAAAAAPPPAAPVQKVATFQNLGTDPAMAKAELYYESTRWGPLGHGDPPVSVGTFPGHRWFIVANGMYAKLFTVGEEPQQTFTF